MVILNPQQQEKLTSIQSISKKYESKKAQLEDDYDQYVRTQLAPVELEISQLITKAVDMGVPKSQIGYAFGYKSAMSGVHLVRKYYDPDSLRFIADTDPAAETKMLDQTETTDSAQKTEMLDPYTIVGQTIRVHDSRANPNYYSFTFPGMRDGEYALYDLEQRKVIKRRDVRDVLPDDIDDQAAKLFADFTPED